MTAMISGKLELLQVLRGIAALLVVLLHFQDILLDEWPRVAEFFAHGYIGVDIFFLISGFVIYVSTENGHDRDVISFLTRRFFRVVVPAWMAMLLLLCIKPPLLENLILSVLFIPLQNSHPPGYGYNFLIVAWTLTYELIFYTLFAAAMASETGRAHRGLMAGVLIVGMVAAIQTLTGTYTLNAEEAAVLPSRQFLPVQIFSVLGNPLLTEFVVGVGLAWAYQRKLLAWLAREPFVPLLVVLVSALLTLMFHYRDGNGWTNAGLLALCIVIGTLIAQSAIDRSSTTKQYLRIAVYLGELSYSIYLLHPIVKSIFSSAPVGKLAAASFGPMGTFLLMLACTLFAARFFYKLVELPCQTIGREVAERRRRFVV